ncbi:hypothetical protein IIE26_26860 (plasmid) [Cytobacillus oceanisediminis]|uniref:hypothetical protein n=1 Tax=Cytobacillus oceanisediminis TaxID=665099 RepID=UPI001863B018|nr:hypothetical protein [Cytobacillus oceanisediminis]QOK29990.1 hypothetical protein IIE26_26860 [Cytobacillus oceanisediminis]
MEKDWWQITEFAEEISKTLQQKFNDPKAGVHYNTVDKWFKALEAKRIHYIHRAAGEKVYDKQDLYIGCFIAEARRDNRYRLDVIYENIPKNLEVRPFPEEFKDETSVSLDESLIQRRIMEGLNKYLAQEFSVYEEKMQLQISKMVSEGVRNSVEQLLPAPISKEEERAKRMDDTITRMRVEMKLEDLAIHAWEKLPESERTKKAGLFRREEDLIKRDKFIRSFKKDNLNRVLEEAYSLE